MTNTSDQAFVTYRKFNSLHDALPLLEMLKDAGIEYEIENASPALDITFSANTLQNEFRVKIAAEDFEKADKLLRETTKLLLDQLDKDYYLFSFTDDELLEVLQKQDEWSNEDFVIARKILSDRAIEFTDEQLNIFREERIAFLAKPLTASGRLIATGWFFVVCGGLIGMIIGWYLKDFKRTLFNGQRVYEFDETSRLKGKKIMKAGLILHILLLILYIVYLLSQM